MASRWVVEGCEGGRAKRGVRWWAVMDRTGFECVKDEQKANARASETGHGR
jgi:hypothetical protein